jgi:hypothetical protein
MGLTNFPNGITSFGIPVIPGVPVPFTGDVWWVDPVHGSDTFSGTSPDTPFATLYQAHKSATSGNNDVIFLIGNGSVTGASILSLALAQVVDSTVTAGTLLWTKNATHLIGICAPTGVAQRALIQPPSGDGATTYTEATFGSASLVTVSGSGCFFANFHVKQQFSTGAAAEICWTDTGQRNCYSNVHFGGMMDAASAADAGSRSLLIGSAGKGEHTFFRCTIGVDTVARSAANASLELAGATPRNRFVECTFPLMNAATAGVLGILGTGNDCVDRWNVFERCVFINNVKSTSATQSVLASFTTASPGGLLLFKDCDLVGISKVGDTNGLANSYVSNVGGASTGGLAVNPS